MKKRGYQYQKTVTIQCDLLKNVPKIQFFTKDKANKKLEIKKNNENKDAKKKISQAEIVDLKKKKLSINTLEN